MQLSGRQTAALYLALAWVGSRALDALWELALKTFVNINVENWLASRGWDKLLVGAPALPPGEAAMSDVLERIARQSGGG